MNKHVGTAAQIDSIRSQAIGAGLKHVRTQLGDPQETSHYVESRFFCLSIGVRWDCAVDVMFCALHSRLHYL